MEHVMAGVANDRSAARIIKVISDKAGPQDERRFVLSLLKHPGKPVLDVGTGDCACIASILAGRGLQVVATDHDREKIRVARKFLVTKQAKKSVRLLQDDITASSLASNSFGNIVCFNVLHHVPRLDSALAELRRILVSDGRIVISDFDENGDGYLKRLKQAVGRHLRRTASYRRPSGRLVLICEK